MVAALERIRRGHFGRIVLSARTPGVSALAQGHLRGHLRIHGRGRVRGGADRLEEGLELVGVGVVVGGGGGGGGGVA